MSENICSKKRHGQARIEYRACQKEVEEKVAAGYSNIMIYEELAAAGRLTTSYSAFCDYARGEGQRIHSRRHRKAQPNTDNLHLHVAYSMIHPERRTRHEPFRDFRERDRLCRQLEQKYNLTVDNGRESRRSPTATHETAQTYEIHTGQESLFGYAQRHKTAVMEDMNRSHSWTDCHRAFLKYGLLLKARGNGLVIQTLGGRLALKASSLDRTLSKAELEKRFGKFQAAGQDFIKACPPEQTYTAAPIQVKPDRDNLYAEYKSVLDKRRAEIETLNQQNKRLYAIKQETWGKQYEAIKKTPMLRSHRQKLLKEFQTKKRRDLEAMRQIFRGKRAEVRNKYPFTTWNQFLRHQAGRGQETALAILRSRQREIQNEGTIGVEMAGHYSPLNTKSLSTVDKMRKIWREEAGGLYPQPELKYTIDAKGTVIFNLPKGGTIRDTGTEIHFSSNDDKVKDLAQKLALAKWGPSVDLTGPVLKQKQAQTVTVQAGQPDSTKLDIVVVCTHAFRTNLTPQTGYSR